MADIATISLKADTSDLERGTQKLKEFGDTAEKASSASQGLNDQFNRGIDHQKKAADALKRQKKELDDLLSSINPTNKAFQKLDEWQRKLSDASKKGLLPRDVFLDYNKILDQTRDKLTRVQMSLTAEGQALLAQEAATNKAKRAAEQFLSSLKSQAESIGKTKTEILEMKAAQLGVSESAKQYIDKIKESNKQTHELAKTSGGLKGTLNDLLSTTRLGGIARGGIIGVVSASVVGLMKVLFDAESEFTKFNKQLILTGNYANKSASQLNEMARVMSGAGITRSEMANVISSVVGTGVFSNNEIARVSKAAAQMNYITGQAIDTTIDQFKRLQDEPLKMSLELEKANHHLTAAQLEQIRTLELQGNKTEAARLAIDAYAQSINDGANDIVENLGFLESAWKGVQEAAKNAWDEMLNIGRKKDLRQQVNEYERMLVEFQINPASKGIFFAKTNMLPDELKAKVAELRKQLADVELKEAQEQAEKTFQQQEANKFRVRQYYHDKYASWETKRNEELAKLKSDRASLTDEEYKEYEKTINYRLRDRKMPGSGRSSAYKVDAGTRLDEENQKALTSLQAQLKVLKEHKTVADVISAERKKLWDTEAKISILEEAQKTRQLTKDEKALLAKKDYILASQEALAIAGDEVELQKQKNRELDQQNKWMDNLNAKIKALREGAGLSSRLQQRKSALNQADTPEKKDKLKEWYAEEDSIRADWELGVKKGFAEFQERATDVYGNVAQISQSAFQGMSDSLSDFVLTGKANFADFTRSFLEMTTKMLMQMAMLNAMKAAFGGTVVGNFLGLKGHSEGGYTGDGGKYEPKGIVHGGEFVFTKEATQRLGIANLYRLMDYGQKGYASGGYVGGSAPMSVTQPTAFIARNPQVAGGGTNININMGDIKLDNGGQIQQSQSNQMNTNAVKREFQQMIEVGVNNLLRNPASALSRTIKGN
ncbi:TPA: phage tail tape measure protein [Providencia stuartii]|uniref:phage tail tape measure protein n=1 Tax=Providencia stuartii TaxID=588 RepID=UPI000CFF01C6|nr:phage tail tape measure protein [Providencia stuartii]AVL39289.1 phage tail tape measure protein [Providencia stuartii]MBG5903816.1 phage tail tape measure protein [Providencia stuartii]MBG5911035.1 phage tail tape measure protein [Providencia stuartii]MBG5934693.1 phage tail tape measure protein [Providencia stuartii]HEM6851932.1 phage tail tape measure protein [Providencia stuartii]